VGITRRPAYADDWLLGFVGLRCELEAIKRQIAEFLRDTLTLELSDEKTRITHAHTDAARFLGYELRVLHRNQRRTARKQQARHITRSINGLVELRVPPAVVTEK
jgi:hypothetical protein